MSQAPRRAVCEACARTFSNGETICPFDRVPLRALPETGPDPLLGTVVAGAYTILAVLGRGGMGNVYRARQNRLQRDVALKILSQELSADDVARERFRTEALAVSQLSNPHTIAIHDFGSTETGLLYLAMQLIEGESLRARLDHGPLSLRSTVSIAAQVCDSLEEAHDRQPQIVHRDVKPDNLMLRRDANAEYFVTVLDFGLARMAGADRLTRSGLLIGTPWYMAPEQAHSERVDARTDLYSLGVVLYEMISGHVPFGATEAAAALFRHMLDPPPPLTSQDGGPLPPALVQLVSQLLEKSPDHRPPSAGAVRDQLVDLLSEMGPAAFRTSPPPIRPPIASARSAPPPISSASLPPLRGVPPPVVALRSTPPVMVPTPPARPAVAPEASEGDWAGFEVSVPPESSPSSSQAAPDSVPRVDPIGDALDKALDRALEEGALDRAMEDAHLVSPSRGRGLWVIGAVVALVLVSAGAWFLLRPVHPARLSEDPFAPVAGKGFPRVDPLPDPVPPPAAPPPAAVVPPPTAAATPPAVVEKPPPEPTPKPASTGSPRKRRPPIKRHRDQDFPTVPD